MVREGDCEGERLAVAFRPKRGLPLRSCFI